MEKEDLNLIARLVNDIFLDLKALELAIEVLNEEKEKASLSPSDLYYIGMANTASGWCAKKSILVNKKMKLEFFLAHLSDRIEYSMILGYLPMEGRSLEDIVPKLPRLEWEDIERVLKIRSEDFEPNIEPSLEEDRWIWEKYKPLCIDLRNKSELIIRNIN